MAMTPVEMIYGPTMLGIFLNVMLYGIMTTQTYLYLSTFKHDKTWMRCFVYFLFFADTLNTAFDIAFLYNRLIQQFGDVTAAMTADWVFNTDPAMTGIIAFSVQLFFAWRVRLLTQNLLLTLSIVFCSTIQMLSGVATAIACGFVTQFVEFQRFQVVVILWLAFAALADVIIAVSLVSHLRGQRTGFAATDDLINKITRMTVQTGAITAMFALIDLISFVSSTSGLHLAFNFPLAKLYTNSLLSTLNARSTANAVGPFGGGSSGEATRVGPRANMHRQQSEFAIGGWKGEPMELEFTPGQSHTSKMHEAHDHDEADNATLTQTRVFVNVEEVRHDV